MLDANKLQQAVDQAYTQFHSLNGGQNADYIPFLANVPSQLQRLMAIVTCDGNIYRAGDSDYRCAGIHLESLYVSPCVRGCRPAGSTEQNWR